MTRALPRLQDHGFIGNVDPLTRQLELEEQELIDREKAGGSDSPGRFAEPRINQPVEDIDYYTSGKPLPYSQARRASVREPTPEDDAHEDISQAAIEAVQSIIRENFGELDAPASTYGDAPTTPTPQEPPTLGGEPRRGSAVGKRGSETLSAVPYSTPSTLTGQDRLPEVDNRRATVDALGRLPGPVQAFGNLPELFINEPVRAFGELYDLMAKGARPSDPRVVDAANKVAGLVMSGSLVGQAPRGALRAGASRTADDLPTPTRDPAGYYMHSEDMVLQHVPEKGGIGRDVLGTLQNRGVRPAEIEALNLDTLLLGEGEASMGRTVRGLERLEQQTEARIRDIQVDPKIHNEYKPQRIAEAQEDISKIRDALDEARGLYQSFRTEPDGPPIKVTRQQIIDHIQENRPQVEHEYRGARQYKVPHGERFRAQEILSDAASTEQAFLNAKVPPPLASMMARYIAETMRGIGIGDLGTTLVAAGPTKNRISQVIQELTGWSVKDLTVPIGGRGGNPRFREYSLDPNNPTYREGAFRLRTDPKSYGRNYDDPHYGGEGEYPNVFANYSASVQRLPDGSRTFVPHQLQSKWSADAAKRGTGMTAAERERLMRDRRDAPEAISRQADAMLRADENFIPPHVIIENPERWLDPILREMIKQARAEGVEHISIPRGETVMQYNPGLREGTIQLYNETIPRRLREMLREHDRSYRDIRPTITDRLQTLDDTYHGTIRRGSGDTPPVNTREGFEGGWTTFPLTEAVRNADSTRGMRLMAAGLPPGSAPEDDEAALVTQTQVGKLPSEEWDALLQEMQADRTGRASRPDPQTTLTGRTTDRGTPIPDQRLEFESEQPEMREQDMNLLAEVRGNYEEYINRGGVPWLKKPGQESMRRVGQRLTEPDNVRDVSRGVGSVVGQVAGAPAGPPGMAAGAFVGALSGEFLANIYEDMKRTGAPSDPELQQRAWNNLWSAGQDAAITGAIVAAPIVTGQLRTTLGKLLGLPPNSAELQESASRIGVGLGAANMDQGIPRGTLNIFGRMPIIGGGAANLHKRQGEQIIAAGNDLFGQILSPRAAINIGDEALANIHSKFDTLAVQSYTRYRLAYEAADRAGPVVASDGIRTAVDQLLERSQQNVLGPNSNITLGPTVQRYLDRLSKELPDRLTVGEVQTLRNNLENMLRKRVTETNVYHTGLRNVYDTVNRELGRTDHAAARLMTVANNYFDDGMRELSGEVASRAGPGIERSVFGIGRLRPSTMTSDEFMELANKATTATAIRELRTTAGDNVVANLARTRADDAWYAATGLRPGASPPSGRFTFDEDKFLHALGLNNPSSSRYRATEEMLRGTGVSIKELTDLAETARLVSNAPIGDASTFLSRAAVLRGAGGLDSALKGALTIGGGVAVGTGNASLLGLAIPVMMARAGVSSLMRPGLLKFLTKAADPNVPVAQRIAAWTELARSAPDLFDE